MNYIKLPSDIFEHDAIQAAKGFFGAGADTFAIRLYFAICTRGYFLRWDECLKWKATQWFPTDINGDIVQSMVEKLAKWGFFDFNLFSEYGILTNSEIQKQYFRSKSHRTNIEEMPYILPEIKDKYCNVPKQVSPLDDHTVSNAEANSNTDEISGEDILADTLEITDNEVARENVPDSRDSHPSHRCVSKKPSRSKSLKKVKVVKLIKRRKTYRRQKKKRTRGS